MSKPMKLLEEENQFTTYNSSENETEEVYEKTKSCENCRYDDRGADEYPCVECCERYLLKFESKPKEPELKPCPFCGEKVRLIENGERTYSISCRTINCYMCGNMSWYASKEEAAKAWNRRV